MLADTPIPLPANSPSPLVATPLQINKQLFLSPLSRTAIPPLALHPQIPQLFARRVPQISALYNPVIVDNSVPPPPPPRSVHPDDLSPLFRLNNRQPPTVSVPIPKQESPVDSGEKSPWSQDSPPSSPEPPRPHIPRTRSQTSRQAPERHRSEEASNDSEDDILETSSPSYQCVFLHLYCKTQAMELAFDPV